MSYEGRREPDPARPPKLRPGSPPIVGPPGASHAARPAPTIPLTMPAISANGDTAPLMAQVAVDPPRVAVQGAGAGRSTSAMPVPAGASAPAQPAPPQPMIELINFGKRYGEFTAVERLNLRIPKGELYGFIGPNGAGKSTTIRFLATLLKATHGEGIVNGHSVTRDPLGVRRCVGYMPDNFGVYDGMRVWEFLDFFAVAYQIPKARRKQVIGDVLELLDLTHKRDDFVNGLSRGMKQRLCLAKTLVHDPPLLILDEPSSGLDPRARMEFKALMKELRRMGKTILVSSHILSELADICTSIGIIERGVLLMHGPIDDVYRRIRRNRLVEIKFVGGMDVGLSVIRSNSAVRNVTIEDNRVTVEIDGSDEVVANLLDELVANKVRLRSFADKDPTLEDVFMLVTKGIVA
ncbi:MAG: ABC transporter ATP-binding protein [Pirellulales bacterium]